MKKSFLAIYAIVAALFACHTDVIAQAQKKAKDKILVNKTYTVQITENGGKKDKTENDEISFKGEKLGSKFMMSENHIAGTPYTATADSSATPPTITFSAEGTNQDGETIKWDGTVNGEDIEGTATITTKKGKTKHEYSFTGALKGKPGKK